MYTADQLLPLSAIQHLAFCERQFALIHIEQMWAENRYTVEGQIMHERVDQAQTVSRKDLRVATAVVMSSSQLGLSCKADVVEFHRRAVALARPRASINAIRIDTAIWQPFPVEYKRGLPKRNNCDTVQLCAQAICLEEMLGCAVEHGALFYGKTRRRSPVHFDPELRQETVAAAGRCHELYAMRSTPQAEYSRKCDGCSLIDVCMPKTTSGRRSAKAYLSAVFS